ncbi:MAG: response regulator [Planctomycetes bacterium]|nr:response regulator [Planctomycetota bacterium]
MESPPSDSQRASVSESGSRRLLRTSLALFTALCASILLGLSAGLTMHLAYQRIGDLATRERRVHALTAEIRYLDEVLTMSANMCAATSEPRWRRRYDAHVRSLDAAIKELREVAPALFDQELGADTDEANLRLVDVETRAFELVEAGHADEARAVLDGPAYAADKALYASGNQRAQQALIDFIVRENTATEQRLALLAILSLGLTVVASIAWIVFARGARDERSRAELARIRERSQAADAANQAKSQFVANMSHELRTPLTAILGYADLLREQHVDGSHEIDRATAVETIARNGEHLLAIINDILDVSKIEAGAMTVERLSVEPAQVVEEVLSSMRVRAKAKGITLERIYATPIPRRITSDPLRLRQIVINLIGNAIKFTERGGITLRVRLDVADANDARLVFAVEDTGIGMTEEQVARVFRPFAQADETMSRRFGGTGLGLTISKRLAELIGGELTATSRAGEGSVFTLTLALGPLANLETWRPGEGPTTAPSLIAAVPDTHSACRLEGLRILLAEDGRDNQRLVSLHLRRAGAVVAIVDDGRKAVAALEPVEPTPAAPNSTPFDVVLMDMQMPELDGYAATRLLRKNGCRVPVIALTAHNMAGDRHRCLDAGCDDFLSKPIDRLALIGTCERWGREARTQRDIARTG